MAKKEKMSITTIIYLRTSTTEQNPMNQLSDCKSLLPMKKSNYILIQDEQSAWNDRKERNGFIKLIKLIKSRNITDIIVWDIDRIYRDRLKLVGFFKLCKSYKVKINSYNQQFLNDMNNIPEPWNEIMEDLMIQIFGYIAQDESDKKSKRVKLAVRRTKNGTKSYKGNKWGRKQLSTFKKNQIKKLKNEGKSIRIIANELSVSIGAVHKYLS